MPESGGDGEERDGQDADAMKSSDGEEPVRVVRHPCDLSI